MNHLRGLIWWAQCSPIQPSKISKSLYIVDELSNHNDLTINLTFKIPSEEVWSTLIYFISQTIRSVLKTWLTRSHFLMLYVRNGPWPNMKTVGKSHTLLKSKGRIAFSGTRILPSKPNKPWGLYPFVVPTISLCKMYLASYYDASVTLMYI